jgi:DnaK suppressor protein
MPHSIKPDELEAFRQTLEGLRLRLQGDVEQMASQALQGINQEASGNLSSVPLHMADLGSENYAQEFTLGLIENEQQTLEQIDRALGRLGEGTFGYCAGCQQPIPRQRLQALPYTPHCVACARRLEAPL